MHVGILVSEGGGHSPDKWAVLSSEMIFRIDPVVDGDRLIAARRLQNDIAAALSPIFDAHQKEERDCLAKDGDAHLMHDHDARDRAAKAIDAIAAVAKKTPWEKHWADLDVRFAAMTEIMSHLATAAKEERMLYSDVAPSQESTDWKEALMRGDPAIQQAVSPVPSVVEA